MTYLIVSVWALMTSFFGDPAVTIFSNKIGGKDVFVSKSVSLTWLYFAWVFLKLGKSFMFLFGLTFFSFGIGGLFFSALIIMGTLIAI